MPSSSLDEIRVEVGVVTVKDEVASLLLLSQVVGWCGDLKTRTNLSQD